MAKAMDSKYEDCFIAYLDILGFKRMLKEGKNEAQIMEIFETLTASEKGLQIAMTKAVDPNSKIEKDQKSVDFNNALNEVSFYIMSDSIVVSIRSNLTCALEALIEACRMVQCELYGIDPPVLLRGAITRGDYFKSERIAFGKAMVDAYLLQENYSKYPRIIISGELVHSFLDETQISELLYRDKTDQYFYIDCLKEHLGSLNVKDAEIARFKKFIETHLETYEDLKIREKYIWLEQDFERILGDIVKCYCYETTGFEIIGFNAIEKYNQIIKSENP